MIVQVFEGLCYKTVSGEKVGPMMSDGYLYVRDSGNVRSWDRKTGERLSRKNAPTDDLIAEWAETPQGPVRTKTVTEIVPGVYGTINIENVYRDGVNIYANPGKWSASDLRAAALVLTQLAEALEE